MEFHGNGKADSGSFEDLNSKIKKTWKCTKTLYNFL